MLLPALYSKAQVQLYAFIFHFATDFENLFKLFFVRSFKRQSFCRTITNHKSIQQKTTKIGLLFLFHIKVANLSFQIWLNQQYSMQVQLQPKLQVSKWKVIVMLSVFTIARQTTLLIVVQTNIRKSYPAKNEHLIVFVQLLHFYKIVVIIFVKTNKKTLKEIKNETI